MSTRPTITTLPSGGRYDTSTLNTNFQSLRNAFDNLVGRAGTSGTNNTMTGDLDMNSNDIRNVTAIFDTGGNDITGNTKVNYAEEWANKAEDNLVSTAAGGDGVDDYSALHHANKAAASASAASTSASNASTSESNASTSESNASTSESNAAASAAAAAASAAGIYWKEPVVNATTANITLSGEQTIDGVLTSTSRILVKDQSAPAENGVYVTAAGAWSRAIPLDTWDEHVGAAVIVSDGSTNGDTSWICTVDAGGTLETTAITWAQMTAVYTSATTSSEGIVELATAAELTTGTDTSRAVTPDAFTNATNIVTPAHVAGSVNAQTGTTYTLVIGDAFKTVTMSNASANTLTIPTNASVAFSTGDRIDIWMKGAGTTTVTGDTGVTVNGVSAGSGDISAQYSAVSIVKIGTNEWLMTGNHTAVA